jgi:maltose phosphorylase
MIITKRLKKAVTSMAGTWMSIVEGFGGMRVKNDTLNFSPKFQNNGRYSFKINFRNQIITVSITHFETTFQWTELKTYLFRESVTVS